LEIYEDIIYSMKTWKSISVKALIREYKDRYPELDFRQVWEFVDAIRKKKKEISCYTDTYGNEKQEFWLLNNHMN